MKELKWVYDAASLPSSPHQLISSLICDCGSTNMTLAVHKEDGIIVKCAAEGCGATALMKQINLAMRPPAPPGKAACTDCGEVIERDSMGRWQHVVNKYRHVASPSRLSY